ncbi:DUF3010 family protein [Reichenbachiella sp.]|uniref:DUF3010 family protein n=1 Tax=Reichenbachiella sp. TaxID=2184521 RepID=UPI003297EDFB
MKVLGIQIKSSEVILVVLTQDQDGVITQLPESTKFKIDDPTDNEQVRQFRDQVNTAFDSISPEKIGVMARNYKAKGTRAPSPMSFKLEGIIQLNEKYPISFIWPQSIAAFYKKGNPELSPNKKLEEDAFNVAYYLLNH